MWRIGELAQATGMTIRALHHYEQIGLLSPDRSESNHRFYDTKDVQQLFKILALKDMGLSLDEIREALDRDPESLGAILAKLLQKTKAELERLAQLQRNLEHLQPLITQSVESECLITVIAALSRIERHIAQQPKQPNTVPSLEEKWRLLGQELKDCMLTSTPCSDKTQKVTAKIREALKQFAAGDEAVLEALANLRRFSPPQAFYGWDPPLFQFLDSALMICKKGL